MYIQNIYQLSCSIHQFISEIFIKFILYIRLHAIREGYEKGYEKIQGNYKYFKAITERVLQKFRTKKPHMIALHGYESIPDRPDKA